MSQPIERVAGGVRWLVQPDLADRLLGPDGLRLEEWRRAGLVRVVKHASHRTVHEVSLPGLHFFLKHDRLRGPAARLRAWARGSKARREYGRALEVAARGVPTVTPVALGENARGPGDSYLVTLALEDVRPLGDFLERDLPALPAGRRARLGQAVAGLLGRAVARLHDAGVVHDDLHPGNLLLRLDGDDPAEVYLIDLAPVRLGLPLGWAASRDSLVLLNRWFSLRASRSERLRFWHAYCHARRADLPDVADLAAAGVVCPVRAREVEEHTIRSNLKLWTATDPRVLRNNRRYRRVGTGAVTGHAVADLADSVLAELLEDPDRPFRQAGARLLKDSRSSTVVEIDLLLGGRPERVICKRFRVTSWKGPWLSLLRPAPAVRSWVLGHALRFRRLPTPRPLVVLHRRRHGLKQEGYLLTVKVPGAVQLDAHVRALAGLPEPRRRAGLRQLAEQVGRLVRDLHDRRLSDRDLKASNVLVRPEPRPCPALGEPVDHWPLTAAPVWLIDLVGVRQHRRLSRRRKVQNLARLHASFVHNPVVSRTDKLRFLRVYLRWGLCGKEGWKGWWRQIDAATQAKIARNARHGRILG